MSEFIQDASVKLGAMLKGPIDGTAKFQIQGEGSLMLSGTEIRIADEDADVVLTADRDTFAQILEGNLAPPAAYMSGAMTMEGDMGLFMAMGSALG